MFILMSLFPSLVSADIGPKPTATIYVQNFDSQDYMLDLLVPEDYIYFGDKGINTNYPESFKETGLYKYDHEGWKAAHIRSSLLNGSLYGVFNQENSLMIHRFSYVGVPKEFKIIVQKENGELVISSKVAPKQFNSELLFDFKTGEVEVIRKDLLENIRDKVLYNNESSSETFLFRVVLTIVIELLVAILLFKINQKMVIIFTNIATQIILNGVLFVLFYLRNNFSQILLLSELAVIMIEFLIYAKFFRGISKQKIFIYALVANIVSFYIGLFIVS